MFLKLLFNVSTYTRYDINLQIMRTLKFLDYIEIFPLFEDWQDNDFCEDRWIFLYGDFFKRRIKKCEHREKQDRDSDYWMLVEIFPDVNPDRDLQIPSSTVLRGTMCWYNRAVR